MKLLLQRFSDNTKQTIGILSVIDTETAKPVYRCFTIEPPWLNNKKQVSCIPTGIYKVLPYKSKKFGDTLLIDNVPNRLGILIHVGNHVKNTKGCILPNTTVSFYDSGNITGAASKKALNNLLYYKFDITEKEIINLKKEA